ncbi:hypothetical protein N7462_000375 [Penicillium macrosclerotiorum]|uniref:uncharacterized protein n=1 Tax=Penicillium macrosclerotiorum TaxID=303699 RepID=UPI002548F7A6|nr:uncharacterized protein N7462_000375 [Penicillium macrosclerotiorum]KAJ5698370.1 hypothetical protein N7462_000375 [Penicillium macrosclerotiorum]
MESSPTRTITASVAGVKRPASLLPAFEPLSSSPSLPRPQKRVAREPAVSTYPTPVPTSSTHIMSSSPPPGVAAGRSSTRRTFSAPSERTPLSAVPTLMLPENGEPMLMGRSSASCHHQLANSRMISRVHVKATYKPAPNPFDRDRVEIMCMGWNGIKIHCQGKKYDLAKGKTFTSDIKDADIMVDVHEARVLVQWPRNELDRKDCPSTDSEQTWDEATPTQRKPRRVLQDSPFPENDRLGSPVSPSPAVQRAIPPSSPLFTPSRARSAVVVYEDEPSPLKRHNTVTGVTSQSARRASAMLQISQSSDISRVEEDSDNDEENDPIIHSFGPFGENLLPRMASFRADDSPSRTGRSPRSLLPAQPLRPTQSPRQPSISHEIKEQGEIKEKPPIEDESFERVRNHAVNQLAFSRLSSTPFSTILNNLPPTFWRSSSNMSGPSRGEIRYLLENTKCIGKVAREGKDAAGKPLESEYYYVPDFDEDDMRRETVVNNLRKPGLRNCRKQHKQYFWKKPK